MSTDIDNDELDKLPPTVRNRILSAEFHEAEAQRWKEEAGETLADLLRERETISSLRQEVETLREALEFAIGWAEGMPHSHLESYARRVSNEDAEAFKAALRRALLPKDKP